MHGNGLRVAGGAMSLAVVEDYQRDFQAIFKFNYFHLYNTYIDEN